MSMTSGAVGGQEPELPGDEQVIACVLQGDTRKFELIMRRYNARLYRVARGILRDDHEAEDALQAAYINAYQHLAQYEGPGTLMAWLTRVVVNEALVRRRRRGRDAARSAELGPAEQEARMTIDDPEREASAAQARRWIEAAVERLPLSFRTVFVLRALEQLSVTETAGCLNIPEQTVKTRLHRARNLLKQMLLEQSGAELQSLYPFDARRCDRVVAGVLAKIEGDRRDH
jgi:RNA polymerase sigma-70 factor (ECF subfamily)